jgi:hypothetical protein
MKAEGMLTRKREKPFSIQSKGEAFPAAKRRCKPETSLSNTNPKASEEE